MVKYTVDPTFSSLFAVILETMSYLLKQVFRRLLSNVFCLENTRTKEIEH